jgi:general secretion pathway protein C
MPDLGRMSFSPRYLVGVNLILLALAAYSASAIVGTVLAARLTEAPSVEISPPPPPIPQQASRPSSYYAVIYKRDIFNSAKPVVDQAPVAEPVKLTDLRLKLWGVAVRGPKNSYAIIEEEKKREQGVYRVGDEVPGGAKVKSVAWDQVILDVAGKDEILEIEAGLTGGIRAAPSPFSAAVSSGSASPRGSVASAAATGQGVQVVSDTEYIIDREEVDNALENMSQLFTQIRAVPHFEGGESTGFRLFAIRRGSIFDKIGLKNGDIIRSVNGQAMNDPTRALGLLEELRDSNDLTVQVTRNRKDETLNYSVR